MKDLVMRAILRLRKAMRFLSALALALSVFCFALQAASPSASPIEAQSECSHGDWQEGDGDSETADEFTAHLVAGGVAFDQLRASLAPEDETAFHRLDDRRRFKPPSRRA
jgi:hypothetical protein